MSPKVRAYLFDMQHAVLGILAFVDGRTIDDFKGDLLLRSAVERQFEIIGEAMTRLRKDNPEICDKISEHQGLSISATSSFTATTPSITTSPGGSSKRSCPSFSGNFKR
jgi:ribonuclease HepT-like protein